MNNSVSFAVDQQKIDSIPHGTPLLMDNGEYLMVRDRKFWFRDYCSANGLAGYIDTERLPRDVDTCVEGFPGDDCRRASVVTENVKATIYINGIPVATAHGSATNLGGYSIKALENAETAAIGRALDLLGFNLRKAAPEAGEKDGASPCMCADSPVPAAPLMPTQPYQSAPPAAAQPTPQAYAAPAAVPVQPLNPWEDPAAIQSAKSFVIPTGKFKGVTVGEMNAQSKDAWHTRFYANMDPESSFGSAKRFPEFVQACRTVWLAEHPEDR